jgi:hypothetical protein
MRQRCRCWGLAHACRVRACQRADYSGLALPIRAERRVHDLSPTSRISLGPRATHRRSLHASMPDTESTLTLGRSRHLRSGVLAGSWWTRTSDPSDIACGSATVACARTRLGRDPSLSTSEAPSRSTARRDDRYDAGVNASRMCATDHSRAHPMGSPALTVRYPEGTLRMLL